MGRRRKHNKHLPPRVYERRKKLYYVQPKTEKWIPLPDGLVTWAKMVKASEADAGDTLSAWWALYDLEVLPKKSKKTQTNRRQEWGALEPTFGHVNPVDLEPHHAWQYFRKRGEIEQARKEVRCLSALMTYVRQEGGIKHENPCYGLQLPSSGPRTRYVNDDEFLAVRELAPTMVGYAMDLTLVTGMAQIDILKLERRQLTPEGILFDRSKTSKPQLIEWDDDLRSLVYDHILKESPQVRRFVICKTKGKRGHPYSSSGFATMWQRLMKRALGLKNKDGTWKHEPVITERYTFHDLRAKNLSEAETDQEAADRGGHADVRITRRHYRRLPKRSAPLKTNALRILDK